MVFETRIHGRGGQGVVTSADLLAIAAFLEGRYAQAFPSFGSERTGAPVVSFCRIDDRTIRTHEPVAEPDGVIVVDPTLLHQIDVFSGLSADGYVVINSSHDLSELRLDLPAQTSQSHWLTVPATDLAREHLGQPLPNAALLGAYAALTGVVTVESVTAAIRQRFHGEVGEGNARAAEAAARLVPTASAKATERETVDA
ncbi:MAG: 2-oxoacid:acceptor oxidoreductase family protein [Solirubrobacteraceae bacterium]